MTTERQFRPYAEEQPDELAEEIARQHQLEVESKNDEAWLDQQQAKIDMHDELVAELGAVRTILEKVTFPAIVREAAAAGDPEASADLATLDRVDALLAKAKELA